MTDYYNAHFVNQTIPKVSKNLPAFSRNKFPPYIDTAKGAYGSENTKTTVPQTTTK